MTQFRINFDGLLKSPASWAKVNRELLKALSQREEVELAIQPRRGFQWQESFELPSSLRSKPESFDDPDFRLTFTFPPLLEREQDQPGHHLLLSTYEATRLPESWTAPLKEHEGSILVPTGHVRRIYLREGIPSDKLFTLPNGYNPSIYSPHGHRSPNGEGVWILTVVTPHYRKGLDYLKSLSDVAGRRDVTWRIHVPYRAGEEPEFWEDPRSLDWLEDRAFRVTTGTLSEKAVATAMRKADLVVQPSRSEGFGLVNLEAMACGTGVVTSDWGGHLDFAGEGLIRIEGAVRAAGRAQYHERRAEARVFELDSTILRSKVRSLVNAPRALNDLGRNAHQTVKPMTWERSAERLVEILYQLERRSG